MFASFFLFTQLFQSLLFRPNKEYFLPQSFSLLFPSLNNLVDPFFPLGSPLVELWLSAALHSFLKNDLQENKNWIPLNVENKPRIIAQNIQAGGVILVFPQIKKLPMTHCITEILDTDLVLQHPRQPILLPEVPIMALSAQFNFLLQCRYQLERKQPNKLPQQAILNEITSW